MFCVLCFLFVCGCFVFCLFESRDDKLNNVEEFTESQLKLSKEQMNERDFRNVYNKRERRNAVNTILII
jgi:hypothetical protein